MGDDGKGDVDIRRNFNYPLVVKTDMNEEMLAECTETAQTAIEKYSKSNEDASKMLKQLMDKKFGASWNVVIGEAFGFEMTHQISNMLYMYFGGNLAVLFLMAMKDVPSYKHPCTSAHIPFAFANTDCFDQWACNFCPYVNIIVSS
eukprot:gene1685-4810_t